MKRVNVKYRLLYYNDHGHIKERSDEKQTITIYHETPYIYYYTMKVHYHYTFCPVLPLTVLVPPVTISLGRGARQQSTSPL